MDPAGWDSAGGDIVARHMYSQPANIPDRADDGIYVRAEDVTSDPRQRHVFAKGSSQEDVGIIRPGEGKNASLQDI
jgi:hypothetical protein